MRRTLVLKRFAKPALQTHCMLVSVARNGAYITVLQAWLALTQQCGMTTEPRHAHITRSPCWKDADVAVVARI